MYCLVDHTMLVMSGQYFVRAAPHNTADHHAIRGIIFLKDIVLLCNVK